MRRTGFWMTKCACPSPYTPPCLPPHRDSTEASRPFSWDWAVGRFQFSQIRIYIVNHPRSLFYICGSISPQETKVGQFAEQFFFYILSLKLFWTFDAKYKVTFNLKSVFQLDWFQDYFRFSTLYKNVLQYPFYATSCNNRFSPTKSGCLTLWQCSPLWPSQFPIQTGADNLKLFPSLSSSFPWGGVCSPKSKNSFSLNNWHHPANSSP